MNDVRKQQTFVEFNRLKSEIAAWHMARVDADKLRQYQMQLEVLKKTLDDASDYLQTELTRLDVSQPAGEFYQQCRLFDLRVIWLRKLWNFYREKFDQRDDESLKALLLAADEVVWSCFHQIFVGEQRSHPAPLPFVEASYSPESFPSELVPHDLKPSETGFLQKLMARLPIPLVSLPQSCVRFPWQLVYVGHEIGHQIQYALLDELRMVIGFQTRIGEIILNRTQDDDYAQTWSRWGREIFADVFSVVMMGDWAVRAMVGFEMQKPATMLARRSQYPSPVVRLCLLKKVAERLKLDGAATSLGSLDPASLAKDNQVAVYDLSFVDEIVEMGLDVLPGAGKKLTALADFRLEEFQPGGAVDKLKTDLKNGVENVERKLRQPRLIACAALAAWDDAARLDDAARAAFRRTLAEKTVDMIVKSRPEGDRNAEPGSAGKTELLLGRELSELLLHADESDLVI